MSEKEIVTNIRRIKRLQAKAEEINAEIATLQNSIKTVMGEAEEMKAGEFKVRYKAVISSRFDTTAFKKTHEDLFSQYQKQSISRRFSIA